MKNFFRYSLLIASIGLSACVKKQAGPSSGNSSHSSASSDAVFVKHQGASGYFIGSFDPPTLGHRSLVVDTKQRLALSKVYVSVNFNTDKVYKASVGERLRMLNALFASEGGKVVIKREALEGRRQDVQKIRDTEKTAVLAIFGTDTLAKNVRILAGLEKVSFLNVVRAGQDEDFDPSEFDKVSTESGAPPVIDEISDTSDGISSSLVRAKLATGKPDPELSKLVHPGVLEVIDNEKLYRAEESQALRSELEPKFKAYVAHMDNLFPSQRTAPIDTPVWVSQQSLAGAQDSFIRAWLRAREVKGKEEMEARQASEKYFGWTRQTFALEEDPIYTAR